ncbi:MAG: hypothetical protein QNI90_02095 [Dinoroseobacter sp.]|nr:hypothetical protein [Dinoroseobacter sp.]
MLIKTKTLTSVAALLCSVGPAISEPLSFSGLDETQWRHEIEIYAFLPASTSGTSTIADTDVKLDLDFSDAVDLLDGAIAGRYEAWKGDWGVIADLNYVSLGPGGTLPGPPVTVDVDIRQSWLGVLAAYRVVDTAYGADGRRFAFDIQGGARYNELKQEVSLTGPGPGINLGGTEGWWEPVVGARGMWEINDDWAAILEADFGGFGVGGNDLQYGINALFDWKPWDNTSIRFGYRYYSIDFSTNRADGKFAYDVTQHGPYFGLVYRWQ